MRAETSPSMVTSARRKCASPPSLRIAATVRSPSSSLMSATTTPAPSRANSWDVTAPMPVAAPVMIAFLPSSCMLFLSGRCGNRGLSGQSRGRVGCDFVVLVHGAAGYPHATDDLPVHLEGAPTAERHEGPLVCVLEPVQGLPGLGQRPDVLRAHLHRARGVCLPR